MGSVGLVNIAAIEIRQGDRKVPCSVSVPLKRSALQQRVYAAWPELRVMSHSLTLHGAELTEEDIILFEGAQVVVVNHCRLFTDFEEADALAYAHVSRIIVSDDVFHSSEVFACEASMGHDDDSDHATCPRAADETPVPARRSNSL